MRWKCNKPVDHLERALGHWYGQQLGSLLWASFACGMTWRWKRIRERETFCLCIAERADGKASRWLHVMFSFSFSLLGTDGERRAQRIPSRQRPLTRHLPGQRLSKTLSAVELVWDIVEDDDNREILIPSYQIWQIKTNEIAPASLRLPVNCLAVSYTHNGTSWLAGWLAAAAGFLCLHWWMDRSADIRDESPPMPYALSRRVTIRYSIFK